MGGPRLSHCRSVVKWSFQLRSNLIHRTHGHSFRSFFKNVTFQFNWDSNVRAPAIPPWSFLGNMDAILFICETMLYIKVKRYFMHAFVADTREEMNRVSQVLCFLALVEEPGGHEGGIRTQNGGSQKWEGLISRILSPGSQRRQFLWCVCYGSGDQGPGMKSLPHPVL